MFADQNELPNLIGKSREYAYIGRYDEAIAGFYECVARLEKLTQLYSQTDAEAALEFFGISQEILDEIEAARRQKLLVSKDALRAELPGTPGPAPSSPHLRAAPVPAAAPRPPAEVYREYAPRPDSQDLPRIPEAKESPSTEARENRLFPFGQKPFEFHWDRRLEQQPRQKPAPEEPRAKSLRKPQPSPPKTFSRARAMAYRPPEDLQPAVGWPGRPQLPAERASFSGSPRGDTASPKKELKRVKLSQPAPSQSQAHAQKPRASEAGKEKEKSRRDYEKPWRVEKPEKPGKGKAAGASEFLQHVYPGGEGPDAHLIQMLEREVVDRSPNVSFDDIAALEDAKEVIQESVLLPLMLPGYFVGIRKPRKGVLLFGPPGTGKTMLAKAVASKGKTTFFNVHSSSLASKWKGDSEKMVRLLFEMARFYAPTTIFIDEIDCIAGNRSDGEHEASRKVKAELLVQIDGAAAESECRPGEKPRNVIVLGATNLPWDLDPAIIRRLDKRIYIPLPDEAGRRRLFELLLHGVQVEADIDWDYLVKHTAYYSGDDITNVCRNASMMPLRREMSRGVNIDRVENVEAMQARLKEVPISMADFVEALEDVKPANGREKLERYRKWMEEFGSA